MFSRYGQIARIAHTTDNGEACVWVEFKDSDAATAAMAALNGAQRS